MEPWEVGDDRQWKPVAAIVLAENTQVPNGELLVELLEDLGHSMSRFFVATPQQLGETTGILEHRPIVCALLPISPSQAAVRNFDTSRWRGGGALMAELAVR